ncbi:MAG: hypothetical protein R3B84_01440 [Zavarzinella sp.]
MQLQNSDVAYYCAWDTDQKIVAAGKDPWDYQTMFPLSDALASILGSSAGSRVLMMDACRNDPTAGRGREVGTSL